MANPPFTFRIDPALKAAIDTEARMENRSAAFVLHKAAEEYVSRKERFRQYVADLVAESAKGVFVSDEAMTAWFDQLGSENELPVPEPDVFLKPV